MAVTVTNSTIGALNTIASISSNAATSSVSGTAEVFTITPSGNKFLTIIGGTGSAASGNIAYSFAAGDLWAGCAITGSVTKNTEKMIQIDSAMVLSASGTVALTLTPNSADRLLTDHGAYVKVFEYI